MKEIKFRTVYKRGNDIVFKMYSLGNTPDKHLSGSEWINHGFKIISRDLYTGLKDKNGKEIYEGDIVEIPNFKENWKRGEPQGNWRRFRVEWNRYLFAFNNEWVYRPLADYDTADLEPYVIEVIGNIYENPDLLANK